MADHTINNFWKEILPGLQPTSRHPLPGWHSQIDISTAFVEAPLSPSSGFDEISASESRVILVSAPGAVGKTTLAREISSQTNAIYIDLAGTEPVGGNTLSGGLVKIEALADWQNGTAALLVDGLDEARLKVTQEGFEAFLGDVAYLANKGKLPIVLFGRTGAIQDTWLVLSDKASTSVLEIGYYTPELALKFTETRLEMLKPASQHFQTQKKALKALLERLRSDTANDGDRFSGYAPVLNAISDFVAKETNPGSILADTEKGEQSITLNAILESILIREKGKLQSLPFEDASLAETLYGPAEQLQHLLALIYNTSPPALPLMSPKDAEVYSNALETWVTEHPFLDGNSNAASAVFEAAIVSAALRNISTSAKAVSKELSKGAAANPFIPEFYFQNPKDEKLPPEHVGVIYSSLRARLAQGDQASLSFDGFDDEDGEDDEQRLQAEVEITTTRSGEDKSRVLRYTSDQTGVIRLGSHLEDVEISALLSTVEIGGARELFLIPPVSIQCQNLVISAARVIVEGAPKRIDNTALLEAGVADVTSVTSSPIVNGNARLLVIWEDSDRYPWNALRGNPTTRSDPNEKEALRRFRKFIISFRSHSKGSLKRVAAKLDHERMTKGSGLAVLNKLKATGIITKDGPMYMLHPEKLAKLAGAAYSSTMAQEYSKETIDFVANAISNG